MEFSLISFVSNQINFLPKKVFCKSACWQKIQSVNPTTQISLSRILPDVKKNFYIYSFHWVPKTAFFKLNLHDFVFTISQHHILKISFFEFLFLKILFTLQILPPLQKKKTKTKTKPVFNRPYGRYGPVISIYVGQV